MKKLLFILMLLPLGLYAQEIESGTNTEAKTETESNELLGEKVVIRPARVLSSSEDFVLRKAQPLFRVHSSNYRSLRKCDVYAEVLECRKSNMSGAEGRLIIRPLYIKTKDGGQDICPW